MKGISQQNRKMPLVAKVKEIRVVRNTNNERCPKIKPGFEGHKRTEKKRKPDAHHKKDPSLLLKAVFRFCVD